MIKHISDTHTLHHDIRLEEGITTIIHSGDSTSSSNPVTNQQEFESFLQWYANIYVKNKVLIAGNHDWWALKKYNKDKVKDYGIIYLEDEEEYVDGKLIYGSPWTPTFCNWHFMKDRSKLGKHWESLYEGIDILVTHGPPKMILDLSHDLNHKLEYCGDSALFKKVMQIQPKVHCFGHIHNSEGCYNQGFRKINNITFSNAACVTDGRFDLGLTSQGNLLD